MLSRQWLDDFRHDIRYGIRSLIKDRAFATTALATLALGVGATTAIFSVMSGVVLRPLPFPAPDRLVQLYGTPAERGEAVDRLQDIRDQSTSFDALAGYDVSARFLRGAGGSERIMTVRAEQDFFSMLGVAPIAGRTFRSDDSTAVAVAAEGFWRQRLGGHPSVIGSAITLDDQPVTIIGIMPDSFQFPYGAASLLPGVAAQARTDLWMLMNLAPELQRRSRFSYVTGRLRAGIPLSAAESELAVITKRLATLYPDQAGPRGVRVAPLSDAVVVAPVRRSLFLLFGAVGLVLTLACANVTNLSLVRTMVRSREVAVRTALGASPFRLVRQFLAESLLLSLVSGFVGLALAWWGTDWLMLIAGAQLPRAHEVGLDWRVFLFLMAACTLTGTVVGLAPALIAARKDAHAVLQESGGHSTMSIGPRRFRDGLVVAEVALACVLAVGAAVLIRELIRLRQTDIGMVTQNVVTFHLSHRMTPRGREGPLPSDVNQFYEIAERVGRLPGVRAAGFTQVLPLQNWGWSANLIDFVRGRAPQSAVLTMELRYVTPGYFQALHIPLRKGRAFTAGDDREAPRVILINETLARRYFGGEDPIGKVTTRGTIVGVVGDVRQVNIEQAAAPEVYYPIAQNWSQIAELGMTLVVSTRDRPEPVIDAVRSVIRDVNPNQAVFSVKTMDRVVADWLSSFTVFLWLMTSFAVLALVLAATGTYGVLSSIATSRTREFAIRVALGADAGRVTRSVLGQGLRLAAIGVGLGLVAALAAAPLLNNLPVTVRPPDLATMAPVALLIGLVGVAACLIPARRAARVDPMSVLRGD